MKGCEEGCVEGLMEGWFDRGMGEGMDGGIVGYCGATRSRRMCRFLPHKQLGGRSASPSRP